MRVVRFRLGFSRLSVLGAAGLARIPNLPYELWPKLLLRGLYGDCIESFLKGYYRLYVRSFDRAAQQAATLHTFGVQARSPNPF